MTGVPVGVLVLLSVVLVVVAASLVAAETALTRVSRAEASRLVTDRRRGAGDLAALVKDPLPALNVAIFVRSVSEVCAATCAALAVSAAVDRWWMILIVTSLAMGAVSFVLIGVSPRTMGRQHPEAVALLFAPTLRWIVMVLRPLATLLVRVGNAVTPGPGYRNGPFASEDELRDMVDIAVESQEIGTSEQRMIHSVFDLGDTLVREVMVPRTDVVFLEQDACLADALQMFNASGYSRIPVIGQDVDDPVGVLLLKDISQVLQDDGSVADPVTGVMRDVAWVPDSKTVDSLLRQMQRDHFHLAMVADEYGGTAGLVTMEDLVEEIVGEIADEHDRERPGVEEVEPGTYRVDARTSIGELEDLFDVELDEEDVDSVGGLLAKGLGRVPIPGSQATAGPLSLTAERRHGRRNRIASVLVTRHDPPSEPEDDPDD